MTYKLISIYAANVFAFLAAADVVPGFHITGSVKAFLLLILVVSAIHLIVLPFLKLVLSPIILLTFGLFSIVINAAILYIVDIYSQNISIDGLLALLLGTLIISIVSGILRALGRS